jgi:exodeoxyribonuclease VII large subunit
VAASAVPIICGVGHETDFTLCDFAADLRAPTPTAAAELATPITINDLAASITNYKSHITLHLSNLISSKRATLDSLTSQLRYLSPARLIQSERQRIDELARRVFASLFHRVRLQKKHLEGDQKRLAALSPLGVLARGYAVVTRKDDGSVVSQVTAVQPADQIQVRVADGQFEAEVRGK